MLGGRKSVLARRSGVVRRFGVRFETIRTLRRRRYGDGDQLTIFPWNRAILPADDVIQSKPGIEVIGRELAHVAHQLQIVFIMVMI